MPADTVILKSRRPIQTLRAAEIANAPGKSWRKRPLTCHRRRKMALSGAGDHNRGGRSAGQASSPKIPQPGRRPDRGFVAGTRCCGAEACFGHQGPQRKRCSRLHGRPILGVVAYDHEVSSHPVILRDQPLAAPSEAVRRLANQPAVHDIANRQKSIVISSSIPGEGKSTIAINLAVSLADAGARVILVDADLGDPRSLSTWVLRASGPHHCADRARRGGGRRSAAREDQLGSVACGTDAAKPSELLGSTAMADCWSGYPRPTTWCCWIARRCCR